MYDHPYPRPGQSNIQECIYYWCTALMEVVPTIDETSNWPEGMWPGRSHIIRAHPIGSKYLTGQCPASNMYYPIDTNTLQMLVDRRNQDYPIVSQAVADIEWKRAHPEQSEPNESTTMRNPGRMGREPGPESADWALGGREDEDVHDPDQDVTGDVPPTTGGYPVTGRGTGMSTIPEVIAAVNGARSTSGEGLAIIQQIITALQYENLPFQAAIDKLEQAMMFHTAVMDGMGSGSGALMEANGKLVAAITFLNESQEAVAKALMDAGAAARAVAGSHDDDERFIQAIASA